MKAERRISQNTSGKAERREWLIVLAGFLVAIPPMIVEAYPNKIINIHPSLIPSFCGVGYYGLHVHEKALARGVRVTGATVHFVDTGTDTGPIILQKAVKIKSDDTPEVLQRRVMEKAEWKILPKGNQSHCQWQGEGCGWKSGNRRIRYGRVDTKGAAR